MQRKGGMLFIEKNETKTHHCLEEKVLCVTTILPSFSKSGQGRRSLELSKKNYGNCQKLVEAHAIDCQYSCHLHKKSDLLVKVVVGLA